MRPAGALWLALRITVARRRDLGATAVLAVAVAILAFLALATMAAQRVVEAQQGRSYRLTPRIAASVTPRIAASAGRPRGGHGGLRTIESRAIPVRRWHEHEIVRAYYSGDSPIVKIPGVRRPPRPGEYYASPALAELMRRDATVAALFSGKTLAGTITGRGLVQPHELRAVVGIPPSPSFLVPVDGFGSSASNGLTDTRTLDASVASMVLLAIWLPGLAVLVIVARLGSSGRRRRSRTLRLLGTTVWTTRWINAMETVVVAVPASVVGSLLYSIFIHRVTSIPWTAFGYFTSDVELGPRAYASVVLTITAAASACTALAFRMQTADGGAVHGRPSSRVVALGLVLMTAGVAYLFALPRLSRVFPQATLGLWIACGFVAVGLAVAGPRLVMQVSGLLAQRVRGGGTLVGLRLSCWAPTTSSRLASALGIVIIVLLGGLSFMSLLNGGTAWNWKRALAAHPKDPVIANDFGGALSRDEALALAPGTGAAQLQNAADRHGRPVVYARCRDLAYLTGAWPRACTGRPQWMLSPGSDASTPRRGRLVLAGGTVVDLPSRSGATRLAGLPQEFDGALLLSPTLAARRPDGHGSSFYLLVDGARLDTTLARLSAHAPSLQFDLGPLSRESPDDRQFPTQLRWLTTGTVLGLALGALALLAMALGEARERASRLRGLYTIGAPRSELFRAHCWSTGAPLVILGWSATTCGWLATRGIAAFDDRARVGAGPTGLTALAVVIAAAVIAILTWPGALKATRRELQRSAAGQAIR